MTNVICFIVLTFTASALAQPDWMLTNAGSNTFRLSHAVLYMPVPPPPPGPLPQNYVLENTVELRPTGKFKVVCENPDCGQTNIAMPWRTNNVAEKGLGGRSIHRSIVWDCPRCHQSSTNEIAVTWIPEVKPEEVLEPVIVPIISTTNR